jgi:hypothetical protein
MYKRWKKMSKDEKQAHSNYKIIKGFGIFLFGLLWLFFGATLEGLAQAMTVMGLLVLLFGLIKKFSI